MGISLNEMTRVLARNHFVLVEDKYFITISDVFELMHPNKAPVEEPKPKTKPVYLEDADVAAAQDSGNISSKIFLGAMAGAAMGAGACMFMLKKD
jgi:hypothetical protein